MQTQSAKEAYAEAWMYYLSGNFTVKAIAEALEIPHHTLVAYAGRNKWAKKRADIHKRAGQGLKASLQERIERARVEHLHGMMDQLEETGEAIASKIIGATDPDDPDGKRIVKVGEKLGLIEQQHRIATSVLKLDDVPKADPTREGFEFLMSLRAMPLPANSDANAGIIRSNNAQLEDHTTHEIEVEAELMEVVDGVARPIPHEPTQQESEEIDSMNPGRKPVPTKLTFL